MFDWSIEQFACVCGMFRLWTRLTGSRSSADGSTVCALLLDQHYFTTQTVASLGLAGSVSFYRISLGLGGRGRGAAVFWRPPVAADYDSSPPLRGRRDALWEDLGPHADSEPAPHRREGRDVVETTHSRERLPVISSRLDLWTCL